MAANLAGSFLFGVKTSSDYRFVGQYPDQFADSIHPELLYENHLSGSKSDATECCNCIREGCPVALLHPEGWYLISGRLEFG